MKRVMRPAGERDLEQYNTAKRKEKETLIRARAIAKELNLEMKIAEAEYQADGKKDHLLLYGRRPCRLQELIKVFASDFQAKVEMRQIGARQESAKVGGIGSCGRELCCSSWLTDFKTVNTTAARYQNLSINQTKLSGQCGRLKCCLNYELDTYMDALSIFPENADSLEMATGRAFLQKKDIFRNLMWYSFGGSSKQYPLTIDRVSEILTLNSQGQKPEDLEAVEIQVKQKDAEKTVDMGFVNDVGQLTLSSLSKSSKRKHSRHSSRTASAAGSKPGNRGNSSKAKNKASRHSNPTRKTSNPKPVSSKATNSPNNRDSKAASSLSNRDSKAASSLSNRDSSKVLRSNNRAAEVRARKINPNSSNSARPNHSRRAEAAG